MKIIIRSFARIREIIGKKSIEYNIHDSAILFLVLRQLGGSYPELKEVLFKDDQFTESIVILINETRIEDLNYVLKEGDEVILLPPTGGG